MMYYKGDFPNGETKENGLFHTTHFVLHAKYYQPGKKTQLSENGYSDIKHKTSDLKNHEKSVNHKECLIK